MLDKSTHGPATDRTLRAFFGFTLAASLLAAANLALLQLPQHPDWRTGLVACYLLIGLGSAVALRLPRQRALLAMMPLVLAGLIIIGSVAIATGWGLRTPGLYFFGVVTCTTCAVSSPRRGWIVTLAAAGLVVALAMAEWAGWIPTRLDPTSAPLVSRALVQLAAIFTGTGAGLLLSRLSQAHLRAAADREQRFRRLLGIAAAGYWETDASLRMHHISRRGSDGEFLSVRIARPQLAWEVPYLTADPDTLRRLRECMLSGEPVHDLLMRWSQRDGSDRLLLINGQPQRSATGRFLGYWGVSRDVTAEHRDRTALADTETRYRDLFRRTPTPMILHRNNVVLEANLAAETMFGDGQMGTLAGKSLTLFHRPEDQDRLNERRSLLYSLPNGEALPVEHFEMRSLDGRKYQVRATAVRADQGGRRCCPSTSTKPQRGPPRWPNSGPSCCCARW